MQATPAKLKGAYLKISLLQLECRLVPLEAAFCLSCAIRFWRLSRFS
jgi:hypothetical protein